MRNILIVLALTLGASPALAKQTFAPYEGRDAVQVGQGGTRIQKHGVDFWTTGTPPRRFRVVGVFTDRRSDKPLSGDAVGSSSVAKKVLEAGGDAVIVQGSEVRVAGFISSGSAQAFGNTIYGVGRGRAVNKITTDMLVVKYLSE